MTWFLLTALVVSALGLVAFDRLWGSRKRANAVYVLGAVCTVPVSVGVAWLLLGLLAIYNHLSV